MYELRNKMDVAQRNGEMIRYKEIENIIQLISRQQEYKIKYECEEEFNLKLLQLKRDQQYEINKN